MAISLAAIGSLVGTGVSAVGGAVTNARAREDLKENYRDQIARYDRLLNRNYVDSPENAGILQRMGELSRENYLRGRATNVVAGGTDAHLAALQNANGKMVSDAANSVAERAQASRDKIEDAKYALKGADAQQMFGLDQQQAQAIAAAGGQATKAMAGIAAAGYDAENPYDIFGFTREEREALKKQKENGTED